MLSIVPFDVAYAEEAKICFADQTRGFQRMALGLSGKLTVRDQPELAMEEGQHSVQRLLVPQASRVEQPGNFSCFRNEASRSAASFRSPLQRLPAHTDNAPEGTRTPNLLIRSQMLYPIELRAQRQLRTADKWCELRTTGGVQTTGFVNERYKTRTCDLHDVNVAL